MGNPIKLYNHEGEFVSGGGEQLNNDSIVWGEGKDNAYSNSTIILPKKNNQYYVFVSTMSDSKYHHYYNSNDTFDFDEVRYSVVDMNANNGKGQIIEKNKLLLHVDEYPWINKTNFTACRHANGRDWWLLKPSARMRQIMYRFLVTPDTIITYKDKLPPQFSVWAKDNVGQSCFNQEGNLYAECNQYGPHTIYNFDRCSGALSLKRVINLLPFQDTFGTSVGNGPTWSGVCFSPNNRFLYTSDFYNVYQIDLWESNDGLAIKRVSKDTTTETTPWGFPQYNTMQLTPTEAIYLGNWNGTSKSVNGILFPNKIGDSCSFKFKYLTNDTVNGYTCDPPNMPFYGLGVLKGSECDTIGNEPTPNPSNGGEVVVLPNAFSPNGDGLNDCFHILNVAKWVQGNVEFKEVVVYNRLGNRVFSSQNINFQWDGNKMANDTYFYYIRYKTKEGNNKVEKGDVILIR